MVVVRRPGVAELGGACLGLLSGLRVGDLDLDAKHRRLTVAQTVVADKGYQRIEPPELTAFWWFRLFWL